MHLSQEVAISDQQSAIGDRRCATHNPQSAIRNPQSAQSAIGRQFFHQVTGTVCARGLVIGIGFVTSVIICRVLGPDGRGMYAAVACVAAIGVQLANFGLHAANTYYVARDRSLLSSLVGNSLAVSVLVGGTSALLTWCVFEAIPSAAPCGGLLLLLGLVSIPFGLAQLLGQNLLLAVQEVKHFNAVEIAQRLLVLGLVGLLVAGGSLSPTTLLGAGILSTLFVLIWTGTVLGRYLDHWPRPSRSAFRKCFTYGAKSYLAALFAFLVLRADILMVHVMKGSEQSGQYSVAATLADFLLLLPVVVGSLLFPRLSAQRDRTRQRADALRVVKLLAPAMVLLYAATACVLHPAVLWVFGAPFLPAAEAVLWLMPGLFLLSLNTILMNYFASTGMPLVTVISPALAFLVNVAVNCHLIPSHGIVGAAISSSLSYAIMLAASILYLLMQMDFKHGDGEPENGNSRR